MDYSYTPDYTYSCYGGVPGVILKKYALVDAFLSYLA